ncbi:CarD family transcriptional regulator [Selenihalanaerobacter shriftii]|uniref:CarD-like/TRCF domain-containing protein n=1 Tax=Selenihalanaerobacter shriftii TaxID=142842 RepID=A0A1T4N4H9_9FIRM|nr:CarD family transcriptional regulator [Selenihalanaerobacter shriftii]SJZ74219.1 CarD-like/TRCF domain-containing protein [Selenihalanaerobacter shriftii]
MKNDLTNLLSNTTEFKTLKNNFGSKLDTQLSVGLSISQRSFIVANLYEEVSGKILLLTYNWQRATQIYEELLRLLSEEDILLFPQLEILPHEQIESDITVKIQRLTVLEKLRSSEDFIVIAPIQALLRNLVPKDLFDNYHFEIDINSSIDLGQLSSQLTEQGYERVSMVSNKGEYSIRGGILDIYPLTRDNPVRIELFGDEVESIREFDLATQRSIKELKTVSIPPSTETLLPSKFLQNGIVELKELLIQEKDRLLANDKEEEAKELEVKVKADIEKIKEGIIFTGIEQYLVSFYKEMSTLIDYFQDGYLIFDAPNRMRSKAFNIMDDINELKLSLLNQGSILSNYDQNFTTYEELLTEIYTYSKLYLNENQKAKGLKVDYNLELSLKKTPVFRGQINQFIDEIKKFRGREYQIIITLSTASKCKRLVTGLKEEGLPAFYVENITNQIKPGNIVVTTGALQEGLICTEPKFVLFTESDLFAQTQRKKKRKIKAYDQGVKISSFEELDVGDYVVHENHGIGKYLGVKTLEVQGHNKDYLLIRYADEDKLYVPTDQIDLIQKYVGMDGSQPKLYSLGSNDWSRIKRRVEESVQEMA